MNKRALVTGGAGFMGAHLTAVLRRRGWDVVVVDNGSAGAVENLKYLGVDTPIVWADLVDPTALSKLGLQPPDVLFHLAGNANVPRSVENPILDFQANVLGTLNVLEYSRSNGVKKVVFPSTASVYRPGVPMPVHEDAPVHASSPYGAAKVAAENYCYAYATSYGLDVTVLRFFNVYGPLMRRFAIHDMVRKLQQDPTRLEVLGDGQQIREYLYVEDAARAFVVAAEKGLPGQVYNVGTGSPITLRSLADAIIASMGLTRVRVECTMRSWPGDVKVWYADGSKFASLGFAPAMGWEQGLRATISYLTG